MNTWTILGWAAGTFLLSWILVGGWIRFSLHAKIIDVPGARSSHTRPTPRGGGVGIVAGVLALAIVASLVGAPGDQVSIAWAFGLAGTIALLSFVDDIRSLSSVLRLGCHLGLAFAAARSLGAFDAIALPFMGEIVPPAWLSVALTVVWIVGLTNVYNFMDGIDGIAGGQGIVAGLAWAALGTCCGQPVLALLGAGIAAACGGFIRHNWSPAKVFMGDVGSAFLGFVFAVLPLLALRLGVEPGVAPGLPVFAGCVVWPFVADGMFTFIRRVRYRENVLKAHRSHLYQRLTIAGWTHAPVSRIYIAWAMTSAGCGLAYLVGGSTTRVAALALLACSLVGVRWFVNRMEHRPAIDRAPTVGVPRNQT